MAGHSGVVAWLEGIFADRRCIRSSELYRLAFEAGIGRAALWSPEVQDLPIRRKRAGFQDWVWQAEDGWPPAEESGR